MTNHPKPTIEFQRHFRQDIHADFRGSRVSSDGGILLLREVDRKQKIIEQAATCFRDFRKREYVEHELPTLLRQRVMGLCLGYEDLNDHDFLQGDPLLALACGRRDVFGKDRHHKRNHGKCLASSSTLGRLELACPPIGEDTPVTDRYHKVTFDPVAGQNLFTQVFMQSHKKPPKEIILDLDATDFPLHGHQEDRFFHGYYDCYCYLPLYIFAGNHLLWAELRPSNQDAATGAPEAVARIVSQLRSDPRWKRCRIIVRADSGFCRDSLMSWCEANNVHFILGLAKNARLKRAVGRTMGQVIELCAQSEEAVTCYSRLRYRTRKSWARERVVTAKVEALPGLRNGEKVKANHRFIVSSLPVDEYAPETLYRQQYCPRGDMENRIKEQQLDLFAGRMSTQRMWSNQIRLWMASVAYVLLDALRRTGLSGTAMAKAQCGTIRLRLLKIGALIRVTARRIWVHLSGHHPAEPVFRAAARRLVPG
jgi:hypothetical protein